VQDAAHHEDICCGQRVGEKIAGVEAQPLAQAVLVYVTCEDRLNFWQVKAAPGEMQGDSTNRRGGAVTGLR
jgi:hypothetical protein